MKYMKYNEIYILFYLTIEGLLDLRKNHIEVFNQCFSSTRRTEKDGIRVQDQHCSATSVIKLDLVLRQHDSLRNK